MPVDLIRRSPCEVYVKYLLVHPKQPTDEEIVDVLSGKGLHYPSMRYLQSLRTLCHPPDQFFPKEPEHVPSSRFLREHKLFDLFHPDKDVVNAVDVLEHPRVKEALEALSLAGSPDVSIASLLGRRFGYFCTPMAVQKYRTFFWDMGLLTRTELRALLYLPICRAEVSEDADTKAQAAAYRSVVGRDAVMLAADLPASPFSSILTHAQFGFMPPDIDYVDTLKRARSVLATRLMEAALVGGTAASITAVRWSNTLQRVHETLEQVSRPEEEIRMHVDRLQLKAPGSEVITLRDLTGGQYNTDYAALPEATRRGPDVIDEEDLVDEELYGLGEEPSVETQGEELYDE